MGKYFEIVAFDIINNQEQLLWKEQKWQKNTN